MRERSLLIFEISEVSRRGKIVISPLQSFCSYAVCSLTWLCLPRSSPLSPLPFWNRKQNKKQRGNRTRMRNKPNREHLLPSPLSIILSPSPDLRFTHHHFRWRASTTTYTMGGATRRGSGARRRTGGAKAADRGKPPKTSP